jgi:multiple antibiotic resistance protein
MKAGRERSRGCAASRALSFANDDRCEQRSGDAPVNAFVNTFLLVYAALFPIVNPFGSAPLFLGLTEAYTDAERSRMSRQIAINSFLLLLGSMFVGSHVLGFFGVSLPIVRVAGGLVVTAFGWKLLNSATLPDQSHAAQHADDDDPDTFYPLTLPLTVGPGSISVAMTLGSQRPGTEDLAEFAFASCAAITSLAAIALTVYFCYRFAPRLVAALGRGGTNVVVRLSAFILLCIGIEILWNGVKELMHLS